MVFSFYLQGVLLYTSLIAFIFYIFVFELVLVPYSNRFVNLFLSFIFFLGMTICHAFSPFLTLGAIATLLLGWKLVDSSIRRLRPAGFRESRPLTRRSIMIPFFLVLAAYWAYLSYVPFTWGLVRLQSTDLIRLFQSAIWPVVSPATTYSRSYAFAAELYAPVLLVPFAMYLLTSQNGRRLHVLLWIFGLGWSMMIAVVGYVTEFFPRVFALAILPMCYGLASLLHANRRFLRTLGIVVLLLTLSLHLPTHYGQDSFVVVQYSMISGLQFFATHSYSNVLLDPRGEAESIRYYVDGHRLSKVLGLRQDSYFLLSYRAASWILYAEGDDALKKLNQNLNSNKYNQVYSNGLFNVYLQN